MAGLYQAGADSLAATLRTLLVSKTEPPETARAAHDFAHTQVIRAEEVFELFLGERSTHAPPVDVWATLLNGGKAVLTIGEILDWLAEHGYTATASGAPAERLAHLANETIGTMLRLAEETRSGRSLQVSVPRDVSSELRAVALAALSSPDVVTSADALRAAIGVVTTADWLGQLDSLVQDLEALVAETAASATRA
jgi:hypothetical protein